MSTDCSSPKVCYNGRLGTGRWRLGRLVNTSRCIEVATSSRRSSIRIPDVRYRHRMSKLDYIDRSLYIARGSLSVVSDRP